MCVLLSCCLWVLTCRLDLLQFLQLVHIPTHILGFLLWCLSLTFVAVPLCLSGGFRISRLTCFFAWLFHISTLLKFSSLQKPAQLARPWLLPFFFGGVSKLWLAGKLLMYLIVLCKLLLVPLFTWSLGMLWGCKLLLICHLLWQYPALQCLWRPTETGIFCLLITATREGTFCTNVGQNWNMKDDCWNFNLIWCERVQQLGLGC